MADKVARLDEEVPPSVYGGKAAWLAWLWRKGFQVPPAVVIPPSAPMDAGTLDEVLRFLAAKESGGRHAVAVRSSATIEDGSDESFAGHFKTVIGTMTVAELSEAIRVVRASVSQARSSANVEMAVIVQEFVDAQVSGVAFSSNPVNADRQVVALEYVRGGGGELMSGRAAATHLDLPAKPSDADLAVLPPGLRPQVLQLVTAVKQMEEDLCVPVDVEWCIEKFSGKLYILQCRPATGVIRPVGIVPVRLSEAGRLPPEALAHDKISHRLDAERHGIRVSPGHVVLCDLRGSEPVVPNLDDISPSTECQAYSVVLIHPRRLAGKIRRSFLACSIQVDDFIRNCQRYAVRSYPEHSALAGSIREISKACMGETWTAHIVIQEVYDPKFAGMVRSVAGGYLVELAKGHFMPKGVVVPSTYALDADGRLVAADERRQPKCWRIMRGYILEEDLKGPKQVVTVPEETLANIVATFGPFLRAGKIVEFGLLEGQDCLEPYLIDFVAEADAANLGITDVTKGIISRGQVTGRLVPLQQPKDINESLNRHFSDRMDAGAPSLGDTEVFLCGMPDISLLQLVEAKDPARVAFAFRDGSVLCHLAVVLRERRIPAIILDKDCEIQPGTLVTLDALNGELRPSGD